MKFKTYYSLTEATIIHANRGITREINKAPTVLPLPDEFKGKRLITIVNSDALYFTFVFEPTSSKQPSPSDAISVMVGSADNPNKMIDPSSNREAIYMAYLKHYTEEPTDSQKIAYNGEVRVRPPFEGYDEFPQDMDAIYFDDWNSGKVYYAGKTVEYPLTLKTE